MSYNLPESAVIVLGRLLDGPKSPRELSRSSRLPLRTVSFALRKLMELRLCKKVPDLLDMRKAVYCVNTKRIAELEIRLDQIRAMARLYMRSLGQG
ncbi:MAG: hypothetical protein JSW61_13965 [Candidatus Thorarchaeota archaeon]|nr:MAG: hypothetical protein JSW61_13965 [Candidatus Thorarchaeota archaeon]